MEPEVVTHRLKLATHVPEPATRRDPAQPPASRRLPQLSCQPGHANSHEPATLDTGAARSCSFPEGAAEDFFYYFAFGVGVVLDVFPFAFGEVAFGAFVVGAVLVVGAEPVAESEDSLDFDGGQ